MNLPNFKRPKQVNIGYVYFKFIIYYFKIYLWIHLYLDLNKHISQRQILESQLTENKFVKEVSNDKYWKEKIQNCNSCLFENKKKKELDLLKKDDTVYKLVGPVLLKQDLVEAVQTVDKRISYIQGEM